LLNQADVDGFKITLEEKGLSDSTVNDNMQLLSSIINAAREDNIISVHFNKCPGKPRKKKQKFIVLTRSAQYTLERICEREKTGILALLALYTGMRIGEISALKWDDVDLDEGIIYVHETAQRTSIYDDDDVRTEVSVGSPKSETSERFIPISPNTVAYLKKHKENADCEYVISCKGHMAEPRVLQYRFESLLKKSGLKKVNFHATRHTYATRCLEEGMDIRTLSQLLGHATVEMTLKYGESLMEHKKKAVILLDNVNRAIAV
jgi:integrase